jgi:D-beta-D-heptose 7-phosphate kinase/D-beta-D-heptose 1-phosphate adenosyltransferase
MMKAAEAYGEVIVALNSDEWLMRKKGYVFMPWDERAEIISALGCVNHVVWMDDSDDTACDAIMLVRPDYFGNGGDRTKTNTPEKVLCDQRGIQMVWNLGGGKVQSSSELVAAAEEKK